MATDVRIPLSTLDSEGRAVVEAGGRDIAVFVVDDTVYALDNRCPHEGNPLVEGEVLGPTLTCAYHGWRFDLETGACLHGEEPLRRYPGEILGDEIVISLDRGIR